jgi:class III poly(R)-hydroxyalkanoic acid synthase PhaE subunit
VDRSEEVENLLKTYTEAQTKLLENWCGLFRGAPGGSSAPFPDLSAQWREIAHQGFKAWTSGSGQAEKEAKNAADSFFNPRTVAMRSFELAIAAWRNLAPQGEVHGDWSSMLGQYTEQFREQLLRFPDGTAQPVEDASRLWQLYVEEWQKISLPWLAPGQRAPWQFGLAVTGNRDALKELTTLYWDAYERTFGGLLESPSLGYARELNEQVLKGFDAWMDHRRASLECQFVVADGWTQAFERFMHKLVSRTPSDDKAPDDIRQLLYLWFDTVDEALLAVFRTEKYVQIQARLMNTAMAYRTHEQAIMEAFLKTSHIPSRVELDETHRRIYDLRKEVRQLKEAIQDLQPERRSRPRPEPQGASAPARRVAGHAPKNRAKTTRA